MEKSGDPSPLFELWRDKVVRSEVGICFFRTEIGRATAEMGRKKSGASGDLFAYLTPLEVKDLEKVRIDRWLWAVRVFKTRAVAAEACKGGKVEIGGENVKPSRPVRVGDTVEVMKDGILREYKVVRLLLKRVGARVVSNFVEDLTPPERLEVQKETLAQVVLRREAGRGRPTKRERRDMERLFGD